MLAKCTKCKNIISRYLDWLSKDPCPYCGCNLLWITHIEARGGVHYVLINIETGEQLSPDPCDISKQREE